MENNPSRKKLSFDIELTDSREFTYYYQYSFSSGQSLESINNWESLGFDHNDTKEHVIDCLVERFRISLNTVVFGDPAGREYVEHPRKF